MMNVKRVQMLRADGARNIGSFYLLPHEEADALVSKGAAVHVDNTGKRLDAPKAAPSQVKPFGPSETKPAVGPSQTKQPVTESSIKKNA